MQYDLQPISVGVDDRIAPSRIQVQCSSPSGNSDGTMAEQNHVAFTNIIVASLGHKRTDEVCPSRADTAYFLPFPYRQYSNCREKRLLTQRYHPSHQSRSKESQSCQEGNFDPHKSPFLTIVTARPMPKHFEVSRTPLSGANQGSLRCDGF